MMRGAAAIALAILISLSPVSALLKEGTDSLGTYTIEDPKGYPVVFIPGVAGSELYADGWNAWPGWTHQIGTQPVANIVSYIPGIDWKGGAFHYLAMDERGRDEHKVTAERSIRKGIEITDSFLGRWGLFGVYDGFFEYMEDEGYSLDENKETGLRYYDFAYDWRKDNRHTADLLDKRIDAIRKETKSDKVIIYAHSMGGVITRLYLADPERAEKVAGVVFLGSPHQGSPKPFIAFTQGYNFGNSKLSDTTMWEIMGNWEAGYQLLPSYSYVQDSAGKFWTVEEIYGDGWIGEQEYAHYLADPENWKLRYGLPNREYAQKVVAFQQELGDTLPAYPGMHYYMVEGVGQETTQYFTATLKPADGVDFKGREPVPVLHLEEVKTTQGDGTVPTRGAAVKGLTGHYTVPTDHGNIPAFPATHPILTQLRKNITQEDVRKARVDSLSAYATSQLGRVQSWPSSGSMTGGTIDLFQAFLFGQPDEEKVKARDELRGSAKAMLQLMRANIIVAKGTPEEDQLYVVIDGYALVDAGTGKIAPSTAKIEIDSWATFDALLDGSLSMRDAMDQDKLSFHGTGVVNRFKMRLFSWLSKYG